MWNLDKNSFELGNDFSQFIIISDSDLFYNQESKTTNFIEWKTLFPEEQIFNRKVDKKPRILTWVECWYTSPNQFGIGTERN